MPKNLVDYSKTIIYKIFCKDTNITDIYVGHTTNFTQRKYQHRISCSSQNKLKIYDVIRKNGGWDNWDMVEIACYNCKDATEARIKEYEHYKELKPTLNSCPPCAIKNDTCPPCAIKNILKPKTGYKYFCEVCDYVTDKKSNINNHFNSSKHKKNILNTNIHPSLSHNFFCDICNKEYNTNSGLWKHKKNCKLSENNDTIDKDNIKIDSFQHLTDKQIIAMLIKENSEFKNMMLEQHNMMMGVIKNLVNNNNVLNI